MPPTLLLLQARLPDDPMAAHEHQCFASQAGLPPDHVVCHDLLQGPPDLARLCRSLTEPAPEARSPSLPELVRKLGHWLDTREARGLTARALKVVETLEASENLTLDQVREGNQLLGILEQAGRRGAGLQAAIAGERRLRTCLADQALKNGEPAVVRALVQPLPPELRLCVS